MTLLRKKTPRWIDLRRAGRFWGRYCPQTHQLELAKGEVRVVFNLGEYGAAVGVGMEDSESTAID